MLSSGLTLPSRSSVLCLLFGLRQLSFLWGHLIIPGTDLSSWATLVEGEHFYPCRTCESFGAHTPLPWPGLGHVPTGTHHTVQGYAGLFLFRFKVCTHPSNKWLASTPPNHMGKNRGKKPPQRKTQKVFPEEKGMAAGQAEVTHHCTSILAAWNIQWLDGFLASSIRSSLINSAENQIRISLISLNSVNSFIHAQLIEPLLCPWLSAKYYSSFGRQSILWRPTA